MCVADAQPLAVVEEAVMEVKSALAAMRGMKENLKEALETPSILGEVNESRPAAEAYLAEQQEDSSIVHGSISCHMLVNIKICCVRRV